MFESYLEWWNHFILVGFMKIVNLLKENFTVLWNVQIKDKNKKGFMLYKYKELNEHYINDKKKLY
jgi:hypothetical protein